VVATSSHYGAFEFQFLVDHLSGGERDGEKEGDYIGKEHKQKHRGIKEQGRASKRGVDEAQEWNGRRDRSWPLVPGRATKIRR